MRLMHRAAIALALLGALTATAAPVLTAQSKSHSGLGFGVNAGFGLDPDQFVAGAQLSLGTALGVFRMVPNAHVGFGGNTTVDVNWDFLLRFIAQDSNIGFYGGVSPTLLIAGDSKFGGTLVAGLQLPIIPDKATNLEGRFGFSGAPDFRLLLTVIF
jgi:hypothetical protein